jgi:hypothetical protein
VLNDVDIWVFEGVVRCKLYGLQSEKSMKMMKNGKIFLVKIILPKIIFERNKQNLIAKNSTKTTKKIKQNSWICNVFCGV